jgi:hypothetical protein
VPFSFAFRYAVKYAGTQRADGSLQLHTGPDQQGKEMPRG